MSTDFRVKILILLLSQLMLSRFGHFAFTIQNNYYAELPLLIILTFSVALFRQQLPRLLLSLCTLRFGIFLLCIVSAGIVGFIRLQDFIAIYGDHRGIFLLGLVLQICFSGGFKAADLLPFIFFVCLAAAIANCVSVLVNLGNVNGEKFPLPTVSAYVAVVIAAYYSANCFFMVSLGASAYLSIVSSFRNNMFMCVISCIWGLWMLFFFNQGLRRNSWRRSLGRDVVWPLLTIAILTLGIVVVAGKVTNFFNADERRHAEIVTKADNLVGFFTGGKEATRLNDSDTQRFDYYVDVVRYPLFYLWPKGLGSRINELVSTSRFSLGFIGTLDSAYYFVIYHFGLPFFICLSIFLCCRLGWFFLCVPSLPGKIHLIFGLILINEYAFFYGDLFTVIMKLIPFAFLIYVSFAPPMLDETDELQPRSPSIEQ